MRIKLNFQRLIQVINMEVVFKIMIKVLLLLIHLKLTMSFYHYTIEELKSTI